MNNNLIHEELSRSIIGAAMAVLNELKPGLHEKLYENALVIELRERGHEIEQQKEFPVHYLIVDRKIIADPKVVTEFNDNHIAQMIGLPCQNRPSTGSASKL
jgi:GxxExxY protein